MAAMGTFTRQTDGSYSSLIKTLSLNVKSAQLRANDKSGCLPANPIGEASAQREQSDLKNPAR